MLSDLADEERNAKALFYYPPDMGKRPHRHHKTAAAEATEAKAEAAEAKAEAAEDDAASSGNEDDGHVRVVETPKPSSDKAGAKPGKGERKQGEKSKGGSGQSAPASAADYMVDVPLSGPKTPKGRRGGKLPASFFRFWKYLQALCRPGGSD